MAESTYDPQQEAKEHVPICAIGASAGGVGALRSLFRQIPDDLGLAYVIIVHLAPEHPSAMAEILSACTRMPVHQVDDTPQLRPNCVYVISPDRELVIEGDNVVAREFTEPRGHRAPVDVFFRSVAAARGDGMAVVLSGAGADGSNGVRAMHEAGAVVFAQDPADAEFPAMPQNAIATGVVSFIAPIPRLAERIAEVAQSKEAVRSLDEAEAANYLRRIVAFLRARTGHDFSSYKRATVMRRVLRRMQICRVTDLASYAELIRSTPEEAHELFSDLLISVTKFFRDEPSFEALSKALAPVFKNTDNGGIRAWSVGCATGEEAYSLAIVMLEEAERRNVVVPIQIFASDLDEGALSTAREGRYPRTIDADVSDERLRRFFIDEGTHYRIRKEVRDVVLFASHSVLKEPPFLRLDLIACRNVLIYLERSLQDQLLRLFHYGLKEGAILFLGSAETADAVPEFFTPVDREARLYRSRCRIQRHMPLLPSAAAEYPLSPIIRHTNRDQSPTAPIQLHAAALERAAPPSVLVDDMRQILHLSPSAGRFILHSAGTMSGKLPDIVRPELRLDLRIALDRALDMKLQTLTRMTSTAFESEKRQVEMHVAPVPGESGGGARALVLFLDGGPIVESNAPGDSNEHGSDDVRRLRADLKAALEALVASRGEHESAMEDLRAANEELQSINEEYRSTSEELETSKEELQSMNEELQTVNAELKNKLQGISRAHSDLQNLITASEIGTLFLDAKLRIRMFTPPTAGLFNITDMDVGRPITDFTHRLNYGAVEDDARRVMRDLSPLETEVDARDGRWFMMRLRPYRTVEDRIDGVVLTLVDITSRRETERQLRESQRNYQTLFDSIDEAFAVVEVIFQSEGQPQDYRFVKVNAAFECQTGLADVTGKTARQLIPSHEDHWFEIYGRIAKSREPERFEAPAKALGRYYDAYAFPIGEPDEHRVGVLFRDVSSRKEAEEQREMLTHELSHRVKNTLAVVQSLARYPGTADLSVDEFRARFIGRIQALARAHDELLQTNWQSADLRTLVESTLAPYGKIGQRALVIDGPPVRLTPKQGLGMALILHELATNASKYGSLSVENGALRVNWAWETDGRGVHIVLAWQEQGGPPLGAGVAEGFGTKLIERACSYELEGSAELKFDPTGLVVSIRFPHLQKEAAKSPTNPTLPA
jgi:two-component system, chemotaxis family, CheB/CheR fusion protein